MPESTKPQDRPMVYAVYCLSPVRMKNIIPDSLMAWIVYLT